MPEETQRSALSKLLATETGAYVLIFIGILGALTILTILRQEYLVLIIGVGALLAFLAIMLLSLSERIYSFFCDKKRGTILGLIILGVFVVLVGYYVPADSFRLRLISYVVSAIFLSWTVAQAYFMSKPISQLTAKIASKFEEPRSVAFSYLVLAVSIVVPGALYPFLVWNLLPLLVGDAGGLLDLLWVIGMISLVGILWILIIRFLRPIMGKQDTIIFGGFFFLVYMLFIFYRSFFFLAQLHAILSRTSTSNFLGNILDILFMFMTIILVVYSFSKRTFQTNLPLLNDNNSVFFAFAFGAGYASAQLYYVAGAENVQGMITRISMLSNLIIFICALFVLLFIPYSYVITKNYAIPTPSFREAFFGHKPKITGDEVSVKEPLIEKAPVDEELAKKTPEEETPSMHEYLRDLRFSKAPFRAEAPKESEMADEESSEEAPDDDKLDETENIEGDNPEDS